MYLQRLEIQGFKSFAQKTVFLFPEPKGGIKGITAVVGPNGSGKCITGDARVTLSDGRMVPIRELVDSALAQSTALEQWDDGVCSRENPLNLKVLSLNPHTLAVEPRPIAAFVRRTAPDVLYRITTKTGRSLTATGHHPLLILDGGEVRAVNADQLKEGTRVAIPRALPVSGDDTLDFTDALTQFKREDSVYAPYSAQLHQWLQMRMSRNGGQYAYARSLAVEPRHLGTIRDHQAINIGTLQKVQEEWRGSIDEWFGYELKSSGTGHMRVPKRMTPHLARFLGYCISEGRITRSDQVWFVNSDEELISDFYAVAKDVFDLEAAVFSYKKTSKDVLIFSHTLCHYLEKAFQIGIEQHSSKKCVPQAIFSASNENVCAFLSALYEGDGHVCYRTDVRTTAYIEYATASRRLAEDVVLLLARFGIVGRIAAKQKCATNTKERMKRTYYSVYIYGTEQLQRATQMFHFRGVKKKALEQLRRYTRPVNPNDDIIPGATDLVRELVRVASIQVKPLRKRYPTLAAYVERRCEATRPGLSRVLEAVRRHGRPTIQSERLCARLAQLAESDAYWDAIVSIERTQGCGWVYDLSVEETHNFVANGLLVHNSNVADAIRWVLGEQSKSVLRSKKAEDVIFFGSQKKAQLGFCEVSLIFNNEDHGLPVDFSEVAITRRLYRSGESEYYLNKNKVRLGDITLLIAQANFGPKSISVIGQGMIDSIINAPASERKEYFDEAAGVRAFQIKKDQSIQKLKGTRDNLTQAKLLMAELEPKVRFFTRQMKRLEERGAIETELLDRAKEYYNVLWAELADTVGAAKKRSVELETHINAETKKYLALEKDFAKKESEGAKGGAAHYQSLQREFDARTREKQSLISRAAVVDGRLQGEFERAGLAQLSWLSAKIKELSEAITAGEQELTTLSAELVSLERDEHSFLSDLRTLEEQLRREEVSLKSIIAQQEQITHEKIHAELQDVHALKRAFEAENLAEKLRELALAAFARLEGLIKKIEASLASSAGKTASPVQKKIEELSLQKQSLLDRLQEHRITAGIKKNRESALRASLEAQKKELKKSEADHAYFSSEKPTEQRRALESEKAEIQAQLDELDSALSRLSKQLNDFYAVEKQASSALLALQRTMASQQRTIEAIKDDHSHCAIEVARVSAHQEDLLKKIIEELHISADHQAELFSNIESLVSIAGFSARPAEIDREAVKREMDALKKKLEQIGSIDPEAKTEYESTKERYEFLTREIADLEAASASLIDAIKDLNGIIKEKFDSALETINDKFDAYFKILFSGGSAQLTIQKREGSPSTGSGSLTEDEESSEGDQLEELSGNDEVLGIEIYATPPQKKLKNISVLSGGEKAMTAIALLCAIVSSNPSPFVVLDEVDAALDDSNAHRFADIIQELVAKTQFIIITHNRVTIHTAQILYGITMGDDGVSKMLSLDIERIPDTITTTS